ncbi:MAG: hypothetical protein SFU55_11765 [Methylophilus sp.]|nr:hypothetical protein [Methylophilus sp.]
MIDESITKMDLSVFDEIVLISLVELENIHHFSEIVTTRISELAGGVPCNCVLLENSTSSQSETVAEGLRKIGGDFSFVVKDSDNQFSYKASEGNSIAVSDLNSVGLINAKNKSYVEVNKDQKVTNIVEKKVISNLFCVGAYSFRSSQEFLDYYDRCDKSSGELYISGLIYMMLLNGVSFSTRIVEQYTDWGTLEDWDRFKSQYATLFVDIDGTLVYNSGQFFEPKWGETEAIVENVSALRELYDSGKVEIILTTSRKLPFRAITEAQLERLGIKYHQIIYGLHHAKRIIINDYAKTNPFKSCDAINIKRDSSDLAEMIKEAMR